MKKFCIALVIVFLGLSVFGCEQIASDDKKIVYSATYKFTEQVRELPEGTDGTAGTSEIYVEFGDWPQSEAADDIKFNENPESNGYYVGSDGNYYAKVLTPIVNEEYSEIPKYFKVEPIKWCVLEKMNNGSKCNLLFSEKILEVNVEFYEDMLNNRKVGEKTVFPNDYKYSQMRAFLNGLSYQVKDNLETKWNGNGFLQTAFTESARKLILSIERDNSQYESINDKIFLLSKDELESFRKTDDSRKRSGTDYFCAKARFDCYWLRSPLPDWNNSAFYVLDTGFISINDVNRYYYGITPALSIAFD